MNNRKIYRVGRTSYGTRTTLHVGERDFYPDRLYLADEIPERAAWHFEEAGRLPPPWIYRRTRRACGKQAERLRKWMAHHAELDWSEVSRFLEPAIEELIDVALGVGWTDPDRPTTRDGTRSFLNRVTAWAEAEAGAQGSTGALDSPESFISPPPREKPDADDPPPAAPLEDRMWELIAKNKPDCIGWPARAFAERLGCSDSRVRQLKAWRVMQQLKATTRGDAELRLRGVNDG